MLQTISFFMSANFLIFFIMAYRKNTLVKYFIITSVLVIIQSAFLFIVSSSPMRIPKIFDVFNLLVFSSGFLRLCFVFSFINALFKKEKHKKFVLFIFFIFYVFAILDYVSKIYFSENRFNFNIHCYLTTYTKYIYILYIGTSVLIMSLLLRYILSKKHDIGNKNKIKNLLSSKEWRVLLSEFVIFSVLTVMIIHENIFAYSYINILMPSVTIIGLFLYSYAYISSFHGKSYITLLKISYLSTLLISLVIAIGLFINTKDWENIYHSYKTQISVALKENIAAGKKEFPDMISYITDNKGNIIYNKEQYDFKKSYQILQTRGKNTPKKNIYRTSDNSDIKYFFIETEVRINENTFFIGMPYEEYRKLKSRFYAPFFIIYFFILLFISGIYPFIIDKTILKNLYKIISAENDYSNIDETYIKNSDEFKDIYLLFKKLADDVTRTNLNLIKTQANIKNLDLEYENLIVKNKFKNISLSVARSLQRQMLETPKIPKLNISVIYNPTEEIGGDIYDISEIEEGHVRIFLADASGHGVPAAVFATLLKNEYKNMKYLNLKDIFKKFNHLLLQTYSDAATFFTAIIVDIFYKEQTIVYSSAAHPVQYALLDNQIVPMTATQMMAGIDEKYETESFALEYTNNFKIVLFTDGLFELKSMKGEIYKAKYLDKIIEKTKHTDVSKILESLVSQTSDWTGNQKRTDDITLIGIESGVL